MDIKALLDILKDIVFMIIPFVCGLLYAMLTKLVRKKRAKKLLRIDYEEKMKLNCFTANTGHYDDSELVTLGYIFEYMAVGELIPTFRTLYKDMVMNVKMSDESYVHSEYVRNDLLLIGGPFHNAITRDLIFNGTNGFPFSFDADANLTYSKNGISETFYPKVSSGASKYYENDYALIINMRNPRNADKRLIAIIGCRSIGCYGAAIYLSNHLKEIKNLIDDDEYAIVINCEGDNERVLSDPKFIKYYSLSDKPQK